VNDKNVDPEVLNPADPVSGYAGIPVNMTGIAEKMQLAGYRTYATG
jgi:arylsulfatase B